MTVKDQLKIEINRLDDHYLELLHEIVCQFPHVPDKTERLLLKPDIDSLFQEIADSGGLGIKDPLEWQKEIRRDRPLPFRGA